MMIENEKGALSHATTKDGRLDYFYKTIRGLSVEQHNLYFQASWRENPLDTIKIMYFTRDIRGQGKGEKKLFYDAMTFLKEHKDTFTANLKHMPYYGYFKDWFICCAGDPLYEPIMIDLLVEQLTKDWETILSEGKHISLVWKWTPSEGCSFDNKYGLVRKICDKMNISKPEYRKRCVMTRAVLGIVEQLMCAKKWEDINFSKIPSRALNMYKKCFKKHQCERWSEYLSKVQKGEAKMNVSQLMPNDIIGQYSTTSGFDISLKSYDEGIEAQWKAYKDHISKTIGSNKGKVLTVLDVSGSMSGKPIEVGMALTLTFAHLNEGKFKGMFIPFSKTARFVEITGETLVEQLQCIKNTGEVANTDFQAVFDLILSNYKMWNVPIEEQIERLFVITDGQWDSMSTNSSKTHFEIIDKKFKRLGYKRPDIIFWNVSAGKIDFPTLADQKGVSLVSGYSSDIMKLFIDGNDISPYEIMRKAIDNERYNSIVYLDD